MSGNEEVSARTRIVLSPGQLFAVLCLVVGAAFWMRDIRDKVNGLRIDVQSIQVVQASMAARLDARDAEGARRRGR